MSAKLEVPNVIYILRCAPRAKEMIQEHSKKTGIPQGRIFESAISEYLKKPVKKSGR